ncbi:MAG: hypothetical protein J6N45_08695 [Alphaproteobacteria bacterium]|nr:hypothetical protein [Alphaproteobacteria bacterium]
MINGIITQEDAVNELYKQGMVCITAHKEAHIDIKYRPYMALFADGTFLVDERAQEDVVLQNLVFEFYKDYPSQKRLPKQYVSPQLLKAVYHRAQDFDWYQPQCNIPTDLDVAERQKLHRFLERILRHRCLSITTLTTPNWFQFYSPDKEKFALFAGEWLVVAQNSPHIETLGSNISRLYPQIEVVEVVPDYYIGAIYERLLYTQPSAREIYLALMRKKLIKRLKISSEEALKVMQNQTYGWRRLLFLSEQEARSMIYSEYVENCLMRDDAVFAEQMMAKKDFHIGVFL